MKSFKALISCTIALVLIAVPFSGCSEAPAAAPAANASTASNEAPAVSSEAEQTDYRDMGKINADQADRSTMEKALNKKPVKDVKDVVIGFSQFTMGNPYFAEEVITAERVAKEYGFQFVYTDGMDDMQKQSSDFDSLITRGVDIIITDLKDPIGNVPDVQRAVDAGIPVIAVDGGIDQSAPVVTLLTASPFDNGVKVGNWMAEHVEGDYVKAGLVSGAVGNAIGEGRRYGMITGIVEGQLKKLGMDSSPENVKKLADEMFDGIRDTGKYALEEVKFEIVNQGWGNWTDEGGLKAAEDIISGNPDINLLMTENDFMGLGAGKAARAAGMPDTLILGSCADGSRAALDAIRIGEFHCTGYNNPRVYASSAIELAYMILVEGYDASSLPFYTYTPAVCISKDNVDEFYPDTDDNEFTKELPVDFSSLPKRAN